MKENDFTYGFDTDSEISATGALMLYAVYRSRNTKRFKISLDMWSKIERFVKASAKRATSLSIFLDKLKPKICCESISPKWMEVGLKNDLSLLINKDKKGEIKDIVEVEGKDKQREFMTPIFRKGIDEQVLEKLYKETTLIIMLVRERLERERPIEKTFKLGE